MTTLIPRPAYTPDEVTKLYPSHLKLEQVQVILRHGERTPTNSRFRNAGLPAYWPYCSAANRMTSAIMSSPDGQWDKLSWQRRLESFGLNDVPTPGTGSKGEVESICLAGELTDVGRRTTLALGQRLRTLYVSQLQFLPTTLSSPSTVYLRATPLPRALESVQQAYIGLYPSANRSPDLPSPHVVTRAMNEETLFPNDHACKRFGELTAAFADLAAEKWNDSPELAYITKKIGKWMPKDQPQVKVDSHPRVSGIMDTINATLAHGDATKLPAEFYDEQVLANINTVAMEEWFEGYRRSQEYRKLGIGALAGDIVGNMATYAAAPATETKISLSGAHDTTLAALLVSLRAFDGEAWPPYSSHVAFELFKTAAASQPVQGNRSWLSSLFSSGTASGSAGLARTMTEDLSADEAAKLQGWYVRVRFNDKIKPIPGCQPAGKHLDGEDSFCTLAAFKEIVDAFTPRDWRAECKMNLGKKASV